MIWVWRLHFLCAGMTLGAGSSVFNRHQESETNIQAPVSALMNKLNYIGDELAELPEIIGEKFDDNRQKYGVKTELLREIVEALAYLKQKLEMPSVGEMLRGSGSTYVRWGRTVCPEVNGTRKVYDGFAAGGHYSHKGGSVELLCLPREPVWGDFNAASSGGDYLYGTEIEISAENSKMMFGENLNNQNVPCAVCQSVGRITSLRIPGRTQCFDGWTKEYTGYLFAGRYNHDKPTDYTCVDSNPETVQGTSHDQNGRLLYVVEANCDRDSLPCPPYHQYREIPCVICTQ